MDEPIIVTNGRFSISIETKGSIKNADFGRSIQLAPGKPDDVTVWKDVYGRDVFKHPRTGHWRYYPTPKDTASRFKKGVREAVSEGKVPSKNILKENQTQRQLHTNSELYIRDSLMNKKSSYESMLNESWKNASDMSIRAIRDYFSSTGETIQKVDYVGNKKSIDQKYITSDILITTDKRTIGVSLKKDSQARLWNSTINRNKNSVVDSFVRSMKQNLERISGEKVNNRKKAKEVYFSNKDKVFDFTNGLTLEEYSKVQHKNLKNKLEPLREAEAERNIKPKVEKVINSIRNNDLIIVYGQRVLDNTTIPDGDLKIQNNENTGQTLFMIDNTPLASINIRQDGLGYGPAIKLEASITRNEKLFKK